MTARQQQLAVGAFMLGLLVLAIIFQVGPWLGGVLVIVTFAGLVWTEQRVKRERESG